MQITLNFKDDTELKSQIREMVAGYIKQMAREEAEKILRDELTRIASKYIEDTSKSYYRNLDSKIDTIIQSQLKEQVKFELTGHKLLGNQNKLMDMVSDKINQVLKEKKFETMIGLAIEDAKTEAVNKILGKK